MQYLGIQRHYPPGQDKKKRLKVKDLARIGLTIVNTVTGTGSIAESLLSKG